VNRSRASMNPTVTGVRQLLSPVRQSLVRIEREVARVQWTLSPAQRRLFAPRSVLAALSVMRLWM